MLELVEIGGKGGNGNDAIILAEDGWQGEDCGNINISGTVKVYAYGGAGGKGGFSKTSAGTGGGGYPGAGIGGGGAGAGSGGEQAGGGGYTGGNQEPDALSDMTTVYQPQENGLSGLPQTITITRGVGGGYFQDLTGSGFNNPTAIYYPMYGIQGGGAGLSFNRCFTPGGNGGIAGQGGIVTVASTATINAFNGNRYTDGTSYNNGANQCPIYAQNGVYLKFAHPLYNWSEEKNTYYTALLGKNINYTARTVACTTYNDLTTIRDYNAKGCKYYKQGIGSGAGFLEISNGSYKIDGVEKMK